MGERMEMEVQGGLLSSLGGEESKGFGEKRGGCEKRIYVYRKRGVEPSYERPN